MNRVKAEKYDQREYVILTDDLVDEPMDLVAEAANG